MSQSPPPLPSGPTPTNDGQPQSALDSRPQAPSSYNLVADKIDGVPNVRKKDNLFQALTVLVFTLAGAASGWKVNGWPEGVLLGTLGGLVAGTFLSGLVLMIVGLKRKP